MGIWDILNKDMGEFFDDYADKKADEIIERDFKKSCLPVITFDRCLQWAGDMQKKYPQSVGFLIAVKDNPDPRNENDKVCVTVGMVDDKNKVITLDGVNAISTIFHGKTVDEKMLDNLNGKQVAVFRLK